MDPCSLLRLLWNIFLCTIVICVMGHIPCGWLEMSLLAFISDTIRDFCCPANTWDVCECRRSRSCDCCLFRICACFQNMQSCFCNTVQVEIKFAPRTHHRNITSVAVGELFHRLKIPRVFFDITQNCSAGTYKWAGGNMAVYNSGLDDRRHHVPIS